jgi:enamine deaminase RidA (YjgF/YER057c/UK114 family)
MAANFINPETMHSPGGYTHVVEVTSGRLAYISGQVALDRDGQLVGGDIRSQTRQVFENIRAALAAVRGTLRDVVKLTTYLLDVTEMDAASVRFATNTSTRAGRRPPRPWRSPGWSPMACSSRLKLLRYSPWRQVKTRILAAGSVNELCAATARSGCA